MQNYLFSYFNDMVFLPFFLISPGLDSPQKASIVPAISPRTDRYVPCGH